MDVDEVTQDHIPDEVLDFIGRGGAERADSHDAGPAPEDHPSLQEDTSVSEPAPLEEQIEEQQHVTEHTAHDASHVAESGGSIAPESVASNNDGSERHTGQEHQDVGEAGDVGNAEPPRKKGKKGKVPEAPSRVSTRQKVAAGARIDARFRHGESPQPSQSPRTIVRRGQQIPAPYAVAPDSPLTNKEQLAILRDYYIKNPTPTKSELIELGRTTGRPWTKVKEYFRQRRNKLRGVEDIDDLLEPERAVSWLHMCFRSANNPQKSVSQLELYQSYKVRFDAFHKSAPLLGGSDLIQLTCATFPFCTMAKDDTGPGGTTEWLLKGIRRKMADEEDGDGEGEGDLAGAVRAAQEAYTIDATTAQAMQNFVSNMPEPLRAGTWLLEDFQDLQNTTRDDAASAEPPITQTQLYAEYAGRFGEVIRPENQPGPSRAAESGEQQASRSASTTVDEGMDNIDAAAISGMQIDEAGLEPRVSTGDPGPSSVGKSAPINPDPEVIQIEDEHAIEEGYEYKPPLANRLLTPLELIQLTKMTFKNAEAVVDEEGRYIMTGIEKRLGVSKFKSKDVGGNAMFPFGLLDIPTSSPSHPFTSAIKRKLSVLEADSAAPAPVLQPAASASDHQDALSLAEQYGQPHMPVGVDDQAMFDLMLAGAETSNEMETVYGEPLPEHDRELVEGLRRFKNSRLGKEVRDTCVSQ